MSPLIECNRISTIIRFASQPRAPLRRAAGPGYQEEDEDGRRSG